MQQEEYRIILSLLEVIIMSALSDIVGASTLYKRYEGLQCLAGHSLGTFTKPTVATCMFACEHTDLCVAFNYFKENSTCDLKRPVSRKTMLAAPANIPGCLFFFKA